MDSSGLLFSAEVNDTAIRAVAANKRCSVRTWQRLLQGWMDFSGSIGCPGFRSPFDHPFIQILLVTLVLFTPKEPLQVTVGC